MLYEWREGPPAYPDVISTPDANGKPITWGALSGLAGDPDDLRRCDEVLAFEQQALEETAALF